MGLNQLEIFCEKWTLNNPQPLKSTLISDLFTVQFNNTPAILKIFNKMGKRSEAHSTMALQYFSGRGSVRLLKSDPSAHLLEFIDGPSLKTLVGRGKDAQATEIICDVLEKLHYSSGRIHKNLPTMEQNFKSLFLRAKSELPDSIYSKAAKLARHLIESEQEVRVLHGDIHHENILKSSARGWLAIDPKGVFGERTYDVANTFYNPRGLIEVTGSRETIKRRCKIFSERLKIDKKRILEYALAYGALSAAWCAEDGQSEEEVLRIARHIQAVLGQSFAS